MSSLGDLRRTSSVQNKTLARKKSPKMMTQLEANVAKMDKKSSFKDSITFKNLKNMYTRSLLPNYKSISPRHKDSAYKLNRYSLYPERTNSRNSYTKAHKKRVKNSRTSLSSANSNNPNPTRNPSRLNRAQVQVQNSLPKFPSYKNRESYLNRQSSSSSYMLKLNEIRKSADLYTHRRREISINSKTDIDGKKSRRGIVKMSLENCGGTGGRCDKLRSSLEAVTASIK